VPGIALAMYVAFFVVGHRETYLAYARTVGRFMPGLGHLSSIAF
jgi:hypothetical protein